MVVKKRLMDGTKMLWHMERVIDYFDKGKKVPPIHIDMGATKACNINCAYCYGDYQNMTGEKIPPKKLVKLFEDAPKAGIKSIALIGDGEPTLNPGLYDALEAGKNNGLDISISTNGVLLNTDSKLESILKNCVWMRYNLSAGTKDGYKIIHGRDRFDKVTENIKRMVELKRNIGYTCEIGLQTVFVPKLMDQEIIEEAKLAIELGVDYLLVKQCSLPDGNKKVGRVSFGVEDIQNSIPYLQNAEQLKTESTDIVIKWNLMDQQKEMIEGIGRPYEGCLGIPFLLQISGNGKVYPCGHLFGRDNDKYLMGDLNKSPIGEIISSKKYWDVIEIMKNFDVNRDCHGACRQDKVNEFCYDYVDKPSGINFI